MIFSKIIGLSKDPLSSGAHEHWSLRRGKRPDGISVMPWMNGRTLVWDATCPDTFAPRSSHVALAAREAGLVASQAEKQKPRSTSFWVPVTTLFLSQSKHQGCLGRRPCPSSRSWVAGSGLRPGSHAHCSF